METIRSSTTYGAWPSPATLTDVELIAIAEAEIRLQDWIHPATGRELIRRLRSEQ